MVGISALSNIIGKKKSLIVGLILGIIGTISLIIGIEAKITVLMLFGQILCGLFSAGAAILTYIMTG